MSMLILIILKILYYIIILTVLHYNMTGKKVNTILNNLKFLVIMEIVKL